MIGVPFAKPKFNLTDLICSKCAIVLISQGYKVLYLMNKDRGYLKQLNIYETRINSIIFRNYIINLFDYWLKWIVIKWKEVWPNSFLWKVKRQSQRTLSLNGHSIR